MPQADGAQWELGAVGNARWTGVRLNTLLEQAGLADDACEMVLEGADQGIPTEPPVPPGPISFARSLPQDKATRQEVLIAYEMNGTPLTRDHGYPVRAVVPGHYGMASVKWLTGVHALRERFQGYWQTSDYAYWDRSARNPVRRALGEVKPKSEIARPTIYERIAPNRAYTVCGAAWAGETVIARVEVSTDDGHTWAEADLVDGAQRYVWRRWKFDWITPRKPGRYTLRARAIDTDGRGQPDAHDENYASYVRNRPRSVSLTRTLVSGGTAAWIGSLSPRGG